jgi:hypothetical protein
MQPYTAVTNAQICRETGKKHMVQVHSREGLAGHVSDVPFGLAALHDLVDVTAGAKPSKNVLSLSCGRRPQHDVESGKVHI